MADVSSVFVERSLAHLRDEYLPRLRAAVDALPDQDLWGRPHGGTNSVGNLLCHLAGNVRQWICSGVGGMADGRDRAAEFARAGGGSKTELVDALEETVLAACRVIERLEPARLTETFEVQGYNVTVLGAIYHVVEHFAWHTGQIVWIAKMREGHGNAFYDDEALDG